MLCVGSDGIFSFPPYKSDPPATTESHNQTSNVKTCLLFICCALASTSLCSFLRLEMNVLKFFFISDNFL